MKDINASVKLILDRLDNFQARSPSRERNLSSHADDNHGDDHETINDWFNHHEGHGRTNMEDCEFHHFRGYYVGEPKDDISKKAA